MVFRIFVLSFVLFAVNLPVSSSLPPAFSFCSGGDDDYVSRPAFLFQPELTNMPQWSPLYLTWNKYYNSLWESDSLIWGHNLQEWNHYFGGNLPANDIKYIIYEAKAEHLVDLQVKWKFHDFKLREELETNAVIQRLIAKPDSAFLQYILLAKACEPFVTNYDYWDQNPNKSDTDTLLSLAMQAQHAYAACHSPFLKLRYGYQAVRLLRYAEDWNSSVAAFDTMVAPLKQHSIIRYWALEQKAGALYKLDRGSEGAYWFSKVFLECPSRRPIAFSSFSISRDSEWNECMKFCKTTNEKTTLFFLRGINPWNSILDEMRNIYALNPASEYLPVLLSREINRLENGSFDSDPMNWYYGKRNNNKDTITIHLLRQFIDTCVVHKKVASLDMWKLASSYLEYLDGDDATARKTLLDLKASCRTKNILEILPCFEAFYDVAHLTIINAVNEDTLFARIDSVDHDKLRHFTISKFQQLYTTQNDTVKTFLCFHGLDDLKQMLDPVLTDQVIRWAQKSNPTSFDRFLMTQRLYSSDHYSAIGQNGLWEIRGTILLGEHKLNEALTIFQSIPETEQWNSRTDPFSSRIRDCRDCDFSIDTQQTYSHLALVQTIIEYEKKIKTDPAHAARYHRLLGNVYYNLTYFGNAGEGLTFTRDFNRFFHQDREDYPKNKKTKFDLDCSLAQSHYVAAMQLAQETGDIELAAECCFMAAKCEQNEYYVTVSSDDENKTTKNMYYRTYFKLMKERYSKTRFYDKAIHECTYFNYFVSR
jgi:hypothetical protein